MTTFNSVSRWIIFAGVFFIGACDGARTTGIGGGDLDPREVAANYRWVFEGRWSDGDPVGYPVIELSWNLPRDHANDPFRIYGRNTRDSFDLIATVTSCSNGECLYTDTNILQGQSYEYYVATLDRFDGDEIGSSREVVEQVPSFPNLTTPTAPAATALDGAAFVQWEATGASYYTIVADDGTQSYFIGETDGTSYLDDRAENGNRYDYFVAGVDTLGHVSRLSGAGSAIPRPDFHADIVYSNQDNPQGSGFRFVNSDSDDPIVAGSSPSAHWRLEEVGGSLTIVPLGQTRISGGVFTTSLTCGPGSESNCEDIVVAPSDSELATSAVAVSAGNTYVLRVIGNDNRVHYAKVRIQGSTTDTQNRDLIVFDWAYQLVPDERSLGVFSIR